MSCHENCNAMSLVTVTEAAHLVDKSIHTLYRHIKAGKLSRDSSGKIQTAELIRVYGELKQVDASQNHSKPSHSDNDVISLLQQQLAKLDADLKALKAESLDREKQAIEREHQAIERERRLMALLESQQPSRELSISQQQGGLFRKLFG
jgi:hypothetical protein